jgi:hypothetical protein
MHLLYDSMYHVLLYSLFEASALMGGRALVLYIHLIS